MTEGDTLNKTSQEEPVKPKGMPFFYGRKCLDKGCKVTDKFGGQQITREWKFKRRDMVELFCTGCVPLDKKKRPIVYSISLSAL